MQEKHSQKRQLGESYLEEQIGQFMAYLQHSKALSENTCSSYRRDLRQLGQYLEKEQGISDFRLATPSQLDAYFHMLGQDKSSATVSRHMATVRAMYRYLVKTRQIKEDVSEDLQVPKQQREQPEILTPEEVQAVLEQPRGDKPRALRDRAILELMYATGIRVSELVVLSVSDVDLRLGFLHCRESGKERVIPFGVHARDALLQYIDRGRDALLSGTGSRLLFVNYSGGAMSRQGVWKLVHKYGRQAGICREVTPHSLRHAFAVHLLERGADLRSVQEMLGHADIAATRVYAKMYCHRGREEYVKSHPRD
ncbi:MAG: tyrosine recombinase [bacterium]|nr:tyrosine recombinase [bacterium]MCM1375957.1 tyrosine recombinase [Muribaculum sp.]